MDNQENQSRFQKIFGKKNKEGKMKEEVPVLNAKGHKSFGKKHGSGAAYIHPEVS